MILRTERLSPSRFFTPEPRDRLWHRASDRRRAGAPQGRRSGAVAGGHTHVLRRLARRGDRRYGGTRARAGSRGRRCGRFGSSRLFQIPQRRSWPHDLNCSDPDGPAWRSIDAAASDGGWTGRRSRCLLAARIPLQHFVRSVLTECEVRDALLFAGATLVILPLLPNQALGPYGALNPRSIWIVVIFGDGDQRRGLRPRSRARASFWSPDSRSRIGVRF
jgi:hypothetical protein